MVGDDEYAGDMPQFQAFGVEGAQYGWAHVVVWSLYLVTIYAPGRDKVSLRRAHFRARRAGRHGWVGRPSHADTLQQCLSLCSQLWPSCGQATPACVASARPGKVGTGFPIRTKGALTPVFAGYRYSISLERVPIPREREAL